MEISHTAMHSDELNYDPDEIFTLLNQNRNPSLEDSKKKEDVEIDGEIGRFDTSEELDKVSIFTFGPVKSEHKS